MKIDITVRLDLSPSFEAALLALAHSMGGRSPPPLRPYADKADWLSSFEKAWHAAGSEPIQEREAVSAELDVGLAPVDAIEPERPTAPAPTAPEAASASEPGKRWTDERVAVIYDHWQSTMELSEILQRLNSLPGPVVSYDQMRAKATYCALTRPKQAPAPAIVSGGLTQSGATLRPAAGAVR